ncbi:btb poz [Fusarium albosuccineum]|uniref:Btb poz n=1 Tax=Fusarium albosuccineum TaxID=1237068 RepID=A0A8H4PCC6_9HYPO|nr:btb poz [Fusarium albosuccineum]
MRAVSPVFNLILGPNFKEGHALAAATVGTPVEIPLPDDDDEAFGWICRALHCQADTNLWVRSWRNLFGSLKIADKYDLRKQSNSPSNSR